jgi:putative transposase
MEHRENQDRGVENRISDAAVDEILKGYEKPEDFFGTEGILKQLTKRLLERMLSAELTHHLGYERYQGKKGGETNSRNGKTTKRVRGEFGETEIEVPRDREGTFEPIVVPKHQTRLGGLDEKIIALYARGVTVRDIEAYIQEQYGVAVSSGLISQVIDGVWEDVKQWQSRPLEAVYPVVYLDAFFVKVRDDGRVVTKAVYVALAIRMDGQKEILGMWIAATEGAKFWQQVLTEIHNRGVKDIFFACVDGLNGFEEAIGSVFPQTTVQLCIVHLLRGSFRFVPEKDRKAVARDLKPVYRAATAEEATLELKRFDGNWGKKYPSIRALWERHWAQVIPFFDYPEDIRRVLYTTNAIESVHRSLRKVTKNRSIFPNDESVRKLMYLVVKTIEKKWTMPIANWPAALNRFAIDFADRMPKHGGY